MPDDSTGRRQFLRTAGAAAFTTHLFTGNVRGANDRVRVGFIGAGRRGSGNIGYAARTPGLEIAAVCDVRQAALDGAVTQARELGFGGVRGARDFRAVLADHSIDAICISTPDHWRARMAVEACQAGKDVWVEAPACVSVEEGAGLVQAARRHGRVAQAGTVGRSGGLFRKARAIVKSGELGRVAFCRVVENRRGVGGAMAGLHLLDLVQWAFDEAMPVSISAQGGAPHAMLATYRYADFVASYEIRAANSPLEAGAGYGVSFHGSEATLRVSGAGCFLFPAGASARPLEERGRRWAAGSAPHWRNFVECIRSRRRPASDIETCVRATATCLLTDMALRHGGTLAWDDRAFTVQRDDAGQYWNPHYDSRGSKDCAWGYTDRHPGS